MTWIRRLKKNTRRFSSHESRLLLRSHTFAIIVILDLKIHQSMWIHWPFFPKTWTKGHWSLDDLWPHVCWGHMCDSTQGSLCPSPMTIHRCMWIQRSTLQNTTYILHTTYYVHTACVNKSASLKEHFFLGKLYVSFEKVYNNMIGNIISFYRIFVLCNLDVWFRNYGKSCEVPPNLFGLIH